MEQIQIWKKNKITCKFEWTFNNIWIQKIIPDPIWARNIFLFLWGFTSTRLGIVPSCNLVQYQGKLMNQTLKNDKKPYFGPDFDLFDPNVGPKKFLWVLPLLDFMHCCKLSLCATSWKSNEPSFRKRQKTSFWVRLWTIRSKFGAPFFFSKIWLSQALYIMVSYHHVQYQKN